MFQKGMGSTSLQQESPQNWLLQEEVGQPALVQQPSLGALESCVQMRDSTINRKEKVSWAPKFTPLCFLTFQDLHKQRHPLPLPLPKAPRLTSHAPNPPTPELLLVVYWS